MKEEYENRLQRAKNKLNEEKARRKSREALRDDASYCSEMSKTSRHSFTSEFSRASSKLNDSNKLPRSEWRNKARAVIERGKSVKEQEEREAQIDSLVERNALLNERERMLKVEKNLLDAAEAAAKAEDLERAESYLGKGIEDDDEDFSLNSDSQQSHHSAATTRTTATSRAKRIQEKEADDLNRSFWEAKKVWQGRCKPDKEGLEDPTPVKSNIYKTTARVKKNIPSLKIEDHRSGVNSKEADDAMHDDDLLHMDSDDTAKTDDVVVILPGSPVSVKSSRSTRSVKSVKSAKSEQLFNSRANPDFIRSEYRDENIDTDNELRSASGRSTSSYRQKRDDPLAYYEMSTERDPPTTSGRSYRVPSSSESASSQRSQRSQRSKHSRHGNEDVDTSSNSYRVKSSSASVASEKSKYSSHRRNEDPAPSSSMSVSSQRSKYSSSQSRDDRVPTSSISVSSQRSQRSKHSSYHEQETRAQSSTATVSSQRSAYSSSRNHRSSGASVSSRRSKHSLYHDDDLDEDDFANMLPDELSIPMIIADLENNGENEPPLQSQKRELSYREKSAMLASMENNSMADEIGNDVEGPRDRKLIRQHDQKAKKHQQSPYMSVALYGSISQSLPQPNVVLPALKEQKNLYNKKAETNTASKSQQAPESLELSNLINENRELKARLEKERDRRNFLDDKTTTLQLEVHQKGEEISQLKQRKDVSASHKEQLYKLEDALHEANRRLASVMEDNARIREELEEEHARCGRLQAQAKHYQTKLKSRSDEVVGLANELKKKDDRFNQALLEERHLREVAESQLAKACQHINISEREQHEELDELEKENIELRHTVQRLEVYLKQKLEKERQAYTTKNRRQSGGSNQDGISSKPTWTTSVSAVSEITTDFECDELNDSQMGEI